MVVFLVSFSDALTSLSYFFIPGAMFAIVLMRRVSRRRPSQPRVQWPWVLDRRVSFCGTSLVIQDMGPHVWIVWMFGAFIVCCGLTHLINALRPWAFVRFLPSFLCFLRFLV